MDYVANEDAGQITFMFGVLSGALGFAVGINFRMTQHLKVWMDCVEICNRGTIPALYRTVEYEDIWGVLNLVSMKRDTNHKSNQK